MAVQQRIDGTRKTATHEERSEQHDDAENDQVQTGTFAAQRCAKEVLERDDQERAEHGTYDRAHSADQRQQRELDADPP